MYSFEGEFRRLPEQNLSGASRKEEREELLLRAHVERLKREVSLVHYITQEKLKSWSKSK